MKMQINPVRTMKPKVRYTQRLLEVFIFGSKTLPSMKALFLAPLFRPITIRFNSKFKEV